MALTPFWSTLEGNMADRIPNQSTIGADDLIRLCQTGCCFRNP